MNKGYTSADIIRELKKYEAAGIDYRVIVPAGIAGMEDRKANARAGCNSVHFTAKLPKNQAPLVEELDHVLGRYSKEAEEALARRRAMFATV